MENSTGFKIILVRGKIRQTHKCLALWWWALYACTQWYGDDTLQDESIHRIHGMALTGQIHGIKY